MELPKTTLQNGVQDVLNQLGFGWYQVKVVVILGIVQAADTMETFIQAILGPTIRCEWNLTSDYVAILATMAFLGVSVGSPLMGYLSDHLGRKSMNILSSIALAYITFLCAFVPNYVWLATLRFIAGFYISGLLAAANSMILEFMPDIYQAAGQLMVCSFDSLVALYITGVGFACLLGHLTWRYFLVFSTTPLLVSALGLHFFLHESPIFLAHCGKQVETAAVLHRIAKSNKKIALCLTNENEMKKCSLNFTEPIQEDQCSDQKIEISFKGFLRVVKIMAVDYTAATTLLLWVNVIWGVIMYGGTTLLPVELTSNPRTCLEALSNGLTEPKKDPQITPHGYADCCVPLLKEGYLSLLSSAIGSFMSFPIALGLLTLIGRKWTINVCFFLTSALLFIETFCLSPNVMRVVFFATRAVASAGSNATAIYTTGLYSPRIRSLAFGVMSTSYRLGVLIAPFLGQVFLQRVSVLGAILVFSSLAMVGFISTIFLPHSGTSPGGNITHMFRKLFRTRAPVSNHRTHVTTNGSDEGVNFPPPFSITVLPMESMGKNALF